jgi:hypothetical protein
MAHFAELDENNIVINVIVVDNNDCLDENGNESETVGIAFCKKLFGEDTFWAQTSYNSNFRKKYAGIGDTFDSIRNAFIQPKLFPSWILDESTCIYKAPIDYPNDGFKYLWNETNQTWDKR